MNLPNQLMIQTLIKAKLHLGSNNNYINNYIIFIICFYNLEGVLLFY